jgi:gamma-glutamyl phosphate reductase
LQATAADTFRKGWLDYRFPCAVNGIDEALQHIEAFSSRHSNHIDRKQELADIF